MSRKFAFSGGPRWWTGIACAMWVAASSATGLARAAQDRGFITVNSVRSRSLALGGAYISIEDGLSAMLWNPAGYGGPAVSGRRTGFGLYVHPLAPLVAAREFGRVDLRWQQDNDLTLKESLVALSLLVKGITYCTPTFGVGVLGFEESVSQQARKRFFDLGSATQRYWDVVALNVRFAPTVCLGASAALCRQWDEHGSCLQGKAYSFGVLLKPNPKMNVGLTYFNLPADAADARRGLERIEDETVNGGVSYYPDDRTTLSLDLRNLNDDEREAAREIHLGVERLLLKYFALRMGYFRRKPSDPADHVLSLGIGIGFSERVLGQRGGRGRFDVLSYTFVWEQNHQPDGSGQTPDSWHALSVLLRI